MHTVHVHGSHACNVFQKTIKREKGKKGKREKREKERTLFSPSRYLSLNLAISHPVPPIRSHDDEKSDVIGLPHFFTSLSLSNHAWY
jgi:hypothetical protein